MDKIGMMDENTSNNNSSNDKYRKEQIPASNYENRQLHQISYDTLEDETKDPQTMQKEVEQDAILPWYQRQDFLLLMSGMFIMATVIAMMFVAGNGRGWDADSGWTHNTSATSDDRFLPEPFEPEEGVRGRHGKDAAARWYYWKVKPDKTNIWTHLFPWICYAAHQMLIWASILHAQMKKAHEPMGKGRYSAKLSSFNWISFGLNLVFHLLHFINTHSTYDGIAQDVSISSSQGSVIMIIVLVMLLEYRDRGIFFGWPTIQSKSKVSSSLRLNYESMNIVRKYHGYAFAWGAIYTFWYHPMENTWGHALGFFYTWIILLQGSLMYTNVHLNKYWTVFIEVFAAFHGGVIAYQTGGPALNGTLLWPMFVFGFALCFVTTQIFGWPIWNKIPKWTRIIPLVIYSGVTIGTFSQIPDKNGRYYVRIGEIFRIPSVYYLDFIITYAALYVLMKLERKCRNSAPSNVTSSPVKQTLYIMAAVGVYVIHIGLAIMVEYVDIHQSLIVLMIIFTVIFSLGSVVSFMLLEQVIPNTVQKDSVMTTSVKENMVKGEDNLGADVPHTCTEL